MSKKVNIEQVANGYIVEMRDDNALGKKPYVFMATQEHVMLEKVGHYFLGYKIKVERQ
jgi:hypothetical protein